MQEAIRRVPGLDPNEIEDIILGCAMPEPKRDERGAQRGAAGGLPVEISAITVNRFCSSGCSRLPWRRSGSWPDMATSFSPAAPIHDHDSHGGNKVSPNPWLMDHNPVLPQHGPDSGKRAHKYGITREQADEFSLASHKKALAAIAPENLRTKSCRGSETTVVANGANGTPQRQCSSGRVPRGPSSFQIVAVVFAFAAWPFAPFATTVVFTSTARFRLKFRRQLRRAPSCGSR